jgi:hypothetical protein
MMRDAFNGAAQKEIRNKRQQNCDHCRLTRVESFEHKPLVDTVHNDAKNDDSRGRDNTFPEKLAPPFGSAADQGPKIWPSSDSRIMDAVFQRGDDRHRRLQNEAEGHRSARPIQEVAPQATKIFEGNSIYDSAKGKQACNQHHRDARLHDRALRWRISQDADTSCTMR